MLGVDQGTAEEFYDRCLSNAAILAEAARHHAAEGDAVATLAAAWGADTYATQAVIWERILVGSPAPQRRFFTTATQLVAGLDGISIGVPGQPTMYDALLAGRKGVLSACRPDLATALEAAWSDIEYLDAIPAPTSSEIVESVDNRLTGLSPRRFVDHRLGEANEALTDAQAARVRADISSAVESAYAGDMMTLEAYLVESADAAGDQWLLTVGMRWDLATYAIEHMTGMPSGFVPAVTAIRVTLAGALGDADGQRLLDYFIAI